jgi:membrane protease YdiL (CAAX protease family)
MTASIRPALEPHPTKPAPWWEILLVMCLSLGITLVSPGLKLIGILIPVIYLIAERHLRQRTWSEIGFNVRSIPAGVWKNIGWILLVGLGIQAFVAFGSYLFLPEYARHIIARIPFETGTFSAGLIIALGISTLGEEIIYRALFQDRIAAFLPSAAAILLSSLVFALMHYVPGPALIVAADLAFVFIDSLIFGVIYQRSHNVFVAWIAHFLGDVVGLAFLLMIR